MISGSSVGRRSRERPRSVGDRRCGARRALDGVLPTGGRASRASRDQVIAKAARTGYADGRATASMFAWIRPNEGGWLPAINNYLLGNDPPAFDLLFWAEDATNVTAALQRDMLEIALGNGFAHRDKVRVLERPIDLARVRVDAYLLAGLTDHIAPWPGCYRSATLLGSKSRFVLADGGHAAVIV